MPRGVRETVDEACFGPLSRHRREPVSLRHARGRRRRISPVAALSPSPGGELDDRGREALANDRCCRGGTAPRHRRTGSAGQLAPPPTRALPRCAGQRSATKLRNSRGAGRRRPTVVAQPRRARAALRPSPCCAISTRGSATAIDCSRPADQAARVNHWTISMAPSSAATRAARGGTGGRCPTTATRATPTTRAPTPRSASRDRPQHVTPRPTADGRL